jgi:hypothetical protein
VTPTAGDASLVCLVPLVASRVSNLGSKDAHTRGLDVPQIRSLALIHPISWTVTSRMSRYASRLARPNGNE